MIIEGPERSGKRMRFVDLFCGIGGFRQALEELGHECVFSSDLDKDARLTYEENYGESPSGDLTQIVASSIPRHQVLCGGFPCQPFSISGNLGGFEDARGTMLHEILRIARHHQPQILLLENVKNYRVHEAGKTLETTLRLLDEAGYDSFHEVLNASRFGVPQKRERIYFVCLRKDLKVSEFAFPKPSDDIVCLEDSLLPVGDPRLDGLFIERKDVRMSLELPKSPENKPLRIGTLGKGGQGERIYSALGHAVTLSAFGGGVGAKTGIYLVPGGIRRLHPEECRRIMGFREGFRLHPSQNVSFRQFGNSVVVPVIRKIFESVEDCLEKRNLEAA